MRTAIVSDFHLAHARGEDLLRDAGVRRALLDEIAGADRLVLLGDVLELRELPLPAVLEAVRRFFEELGEAMSGREIIFVPGNHDHRLAEPLLERNALAGRPLELEQSDEPRGEAESRIATWLGNARARIAYPGIWLRDDVYATHGHYMDCHWRLPRIECVAAAGVMRAFGPVPEAARPGDYERVLRPIYAFNFSLAQ
ncbi:MAG TPA: metallophosphoesterase, partial [Solirubrobacterales bacterium]|nr:metallophosphoesterase [Solirubrobacterales bacterium]